MHVKLQAFFRYTVQSEVFLLIFYFHLQYTSFLRLIISVEF